MIKLGIKKLVFFGKICLNLIVFKFGIIILVIFLVICKKVLKELVFFKFVLKFKLFRKFWLICIVRVLR